MSMTTEQRKEWAYGILDRWIKDQEAGEMVDLLEEYLSRQDDDNDLHEVVNDLTLNVDMMREELVAVQDELDKIAEERAS